LVEVLIVLLIFSGMFLVMLNAFENSIASLNNTKAKTVGVEIANAQMEILRNISYEDLGTVFGSPTGAISDERTIERSELTFTVKTIITYVDDPYDGCVGEVVGEPNQSQCADGTIVNEPPDLPPNNNPADYKKADVEVTWDKYFRGNPIRLSTIIAPEHLEGDTDKGFLLIKVIGANSTPVSGATVNVINNDVSPAVNIVATTNSYGHVLLLDLEPSSQTYIVKVSKAGYSSARTCTEDAGGSACNDSEGVPDPVQGKISVIQGSLEEETFAIDLFSTLAFNSYSDTCTPLPNIDFTLKGSLRDGQLGKKISHEPAPDGILKNSFDFTTDGLGQWIKNDLEWDIYDLFVNTAGYDIAGINHDLALNILPSTSTTLNVLLAPSSANSLLVTVKDSGTETNLANASVQVSNASYDETKLTGQGFIEQSDWIDGSGYDSFAEGKYYFDSGSVDESTTSGQVTLSLTENNFIFSEDFNDSVYKDATATDADWNTSDQELKLPTFSGEYPTDRAYAGQTTKLNSQHGKIVSATLNADETLNGQTVSYFLSANGGTNFEAVSLGIEHNFLTVGDDIRIRIEMESDNISETPVVDNLSLDYDIQYFDPAGELISGTFDLNSPADFTTIDWTSESQPADTQLKFQLATSNCANGKTNPPACDDAGDWNFLGPDGTGATYYESINADINSTHDANQYLRYKAYLTTSDIYYTPTLSHIRIGYTLSCLPSGQSFFGGLSNDTYGINVSLAGYQDYAGTVDVNGYTTQEILLTPNP